MRRSQVRLLFPAPRNPEKKTTARPPHPTAGNLPEYAQPALPPRRAVCFSAPHLPARRPRAPHSRKATARTAASRRPAPPEPPASASSASPPSSLQSIDGRCHRRSRCAFAHRRTAHRDPCAAPSVETPRRHPQASASNADPHHRLAGRRIACATTRNTNHRDAAAQQRATVQRSLRSLQRLSHHTSSRPNLRDRRRDTRPIRDRVAALSHRTARMSRFVRSRQSARARDGRVSPRGRGCRGPPPLPTLDEAGAP